jgi:K+ transporter
MGKAVKLPFIFMSRNAADATSFFTLPADQTIEVGVRLEI